jgi:hypothetical protein
MKAVAGQCSTVKIVNSLMIIRSYKPKMVGTFRQTGPIPYPKHSSEYQRKGKMLVR